MNTKDSHIISRPPVVAIMGHIDHGKSTLLSYIRKSNTPLNEAGGITQHISAYEVIHKNTQDSDATEHTITFLDTPGHEAFSGIRTRGATAADIAVLVVAVDDGVKTQTLEAYKSIIGSKTPFIVALNKIDKPDANIERTKQSLAENEIYIEGYGGDIPVVAISAKTGEGVAELLDMILLVAEIENLTGDPNLPATGIVIESNRDEKKGITASCIIQNGTLKKGSYITSGTSSAPVRIIENYLGKHIDEATFSSPIKIIGWDSLPQVGSTFKTFADRSEARSDIEKAIESGHTQKTHAGKTHAETDTLVPLIVKADTGGSLEAVLHEIQKLQNKLQNATLHGEHAAGTSSPLPIVRPHVISSGIGIISENDVLRAGGTLKAIVVGFHTDIDSQAKNLAERNGIDIQTFDIIYKLSEWLTETLTARTPKIEVEDSLGVAKILKIFSKTKDRQIIGAKVESGTITLGSQVKILRRDVEIGRGRVKELQQAKNRTNEVGVGIEFGTLIEAKIEIAPGDRIESFNLIER